MDAKANWNGCSVCLHEGDITKLSVDAIVNAANPWLAGGGGVDGAIHRAGGPRIMEECQRIMASRQSILRPGEAVVTGGGDLPARWVIHTVGPVYERHEPAEAAHLLAACYSASLALLRQNGGQSIAFPCISTGVYGYPPREACPVALNAVRSELEQNSACNQVVFCAFDEFDYQIYESVLTAM
jgi:O-acetyl-ADP-ribose deacetylase (regulator of RNase III)